jgi:hypothetical protein
MCEKVFWSGATDLSESLYLIEYKMFNMSLGKPLKAEHLLVRQQCFPLNLILVLLL